MRLLYLWVKGLGDGVDLELNFDSKYRFSYLSDDRRITLAVGEDPLPETFFAENQEKCCITNVNVVVGRNGSGKTSISRCLYNIRLNEDCSTNFDYVFVYEKNNFLKVQWCLHDADGVPAEFELWLPESPVGMEGWEKCTYSPQCKRNMAFWDFEFAYFSPHFTTESQIPNQSLAVENLSTNGLMYGGFEEAHNRPFTYSDSESIKKNYLATEHRMGLAVLRAIPREQAGGVDLPEINGVMIRTHEVEFQENCKWLAMIKRNLREQNHVPDKAQWVGRKLSDIEIIERAIQYSKGNFNSDNQDFVAHCYVAYMLTYVRISGYFDEKHNPMFTSFAYRLIETYKNVVELFYQNHLHDVGEFYCKLVSDLRKHIFIFKRRPGDLVERSEDRKERFAIVRVFIQLIRWNKEYVHGHHGMKSDSLTIVDSGDDSIGSFFDNYQNAMQRFDFLSFSYVPTLSAGQMAYLTIYSRIYDFIARCAASREYKEMYEKSNAVDEMPLHLKSRSFSQDYLLFLDEAETTLHPEWQRSIVFNLIKFLEYIAIGQRFHIVFATHSPMLLSDIPKSNVTFLKGDNEDNSEFDESVKRLTNTFGANVFDLYRLGFFLNEGAVGKFAAHKIKRLLDKCNKGERVDEADSRLCKLIGDTMVRNYLQAIVNQGLYGQIENT